MCIEDQLKKNGFVSTQGLTDWQEQQLQASVRKGEAMRLKNGVYAHIDALAGTMVDIRLIFLMAFSVFGRHGRFIISLLRFRMLTMWPLSVVEK